MTSRRMLAGIAMGMLLLTANAGTAFVRMRELDENTRQAARTQQLLAKLHETHFLAQTVESARHRFLLVEDPQHLVSARTAAANIGRLVEELRRLTDRNPRHEGRLDRLEDLAEETLRELEELTGNQQRNFALAREELKSAAGQRVVDEIQSLIDEMRREEEVLLAERHRGSRSSLIGARATLLVSGLGDLALALLAFMLIRRDARIRSESERQLRDYALAQEQTNRELSRLCDEAEAATRAKSEFIANMSHEIRTPISAILGHAELLLSGRSIMPQQLRSARAIQRNGEHLLRLINDILDLSKVEAGKLTIERSRCSPLEILNDVRWMMEARALKRGLSLDVEVSGTIPKSIECDVTRLRQILLNLVGNAIKFTERGGIRLVCRTDDNGSPGQRHRLRVDVIDTGIGISAEQLDRLFQPFVQADSSTARRFGGTGLGLFISRRLAEALGGTIEAESRQGEGSRFSLLLPFEAIGRQEPSGQGPLYAELESLLESPTAVDDELPGLAERRVLLAEDGADNQYLIAHHLRSAKMEVEVVSNGQLAAERALVAAGSGQPYDLILMDMQMPECDGYTATTRLRAAGYTGRIVALTAHATKEDRKRCLAVGCDDYLPKPVTCGQLLHTVAENLSSTAAKAVSAPSHAGSPYGKKRMPIVSTLAGDPRMTEPIERFVNHLPDRAESLLAAAERGDRGTLLREAHQLKGAAGGYGFQSLTDAARALEVDLRQSNESADFDLTSLHELVDMCRRAAAPHENHSSERENAPHCPGH